MDRTQLQQVRRFNRVATERAGALQESYLRRGRPLGEARLIFEIGPSGADVRELRSRLGMDSGYLSRLLRSLEAQGLLSVQQQLQDGRLRSVNLTAAGQIELAEYNRLSDQLAESILDPLGAAEREHLVSAMARVEQLLHEAGVSVHLEPPGSADARWCLGRYFRELAGRFEAGFDPTLSNPARDEEMTPPAGFFVVARLGAEPVGCGALKRRTATKGEIKRMWTARSARRQGVARRVLQTLERIARECGLTTLRLETNRTLAEAQALYRQQGYREVEPFNNEPYAHHWFEKSL